MLSAIKMGAHKTGSGQCSIVKRAKEPICVELVDLLRSVPLEILDAVSAAPWLTKSLRTSKLSNPKTPL